MPSNAVDPSRILFLQARSSDVAEIVDLVQSAYRGDASRKGWTTEADLLDGQRVDEPMVAELINGEDSTVLTARLDGLLVGCCELRRIIADGQDSTDSGTTAYLGMFAVQPDLQAAGLGRKILEAAEEMAGDLWGANRIVLTVISIRRELIDWYERRGFTLTGVSSSFPYDDERFGQPRRPDLEFVELAKQI